MPRLLLVDDNPSIHRIAESLLAHTDIALVCADSAQQALEKIQGGETFDVALIDTAMPVMDGWQLLEALRANASTSRIPIAMMAGVLDQVDPQKLASAHIQGYLKKPIELRDLQDRVRKLTSLHVAEFHPEPVPEPEPVFLPPPLPPPPPSIPPLPPQPEPILLPEPPQPAPPPLVLEDVLVLGPEDLWVEESPASLPSPAIEELPTGDADLVAFGEMPESEPSVLLPEDNPPQLEQEAFLELEEFDVKSLADLPASSEAPGFQLEPLSPAEPATSDELEPLEELQHETQAVTPEDLMAAMQAYAEAEAPALSAGPPTAPVTIDEAIYQTQAEYEDIAPAHQPETAQVEEEKLPSQMIEDFRQEELLEPTLESPLSVEPSESLLPEEAPTESGPAATQPLTMSFEREIPEEDRALATADELVEDGTMADWLREDEPSAPTLLLPESPEVDEVQSTLPAESEEVTTAVELPEAEPHEPMPEQALTMEETPFVPELPGDYSQEEFVAAEEQASAGTEDHLVEEEEPVPTAPSFPPEPVFVWPNLDQPALPEFSQEPEGETATQAEPPADDLLHTVVEEAAPVQAEKAPLDLDAQVEETYSEQAFMEAPTEASVPELTFQEPEPAPEPMDELLQVPEPSELAPIAPEPNLAALEALLDSHIAEASSTTLEPQVEEVAESVRSAEETPIPTPPLPLVSALSPQEWLPIFLQDPVFMDALAKAVVARLGDQALKEIAWEVMPDMLERIQR